MVRQRSRHRLGQTSRKMQGLPVADQHSIPLCGRILWHSVWRRIRSGQSPLDTFTLVFVGSNSALVASRMQLLCWLLDRVRPNMSLKFF